MLEATAGSRRLPFSFQAPGGVGRLSLTGLDVGALTIDQLELDVSDLGTAPGPTTAAERFQRRRTRLRTLAIHTSAAAIEARLAAITRHLAGLGITGVAARLGDGFVSIRARAADGLATADVSFRIELVAAGVHVRAIASHIRVHGHLPTPGPVVADRVLVALFAATDVPGMVERPHSRGLCDIEIDLIGALLWHLMPPAGWRLPATNDVELVHLRIARTAIEVGFGPSGSRTGELGVRAQALQLASTHDLMHSADDQVRAGHVEEAMRGYRALLAAGGPDQPLLLERILALAAARPAWYFDGLELARQALRRWPQFGAAHAALGSITLAQGDAREAARHLTQLAQLASAEVDDDQAALAALAGARLLRVLDPRSATALYELALEHDPSSAEAADALADRLGDEQRWTELVRLLRSRAVEADDVRAVELRLRLADVLVHRLNDPLGAHHELDTARSLAPNDPAVFEMTAMILAASDPKAAVEAWRDVARLAAERDDHRTGARAFAMIGELLSADGAIDDSVTAWTRALELDPLQHAAIAGLAGIAAAKGDHLVAADLYQRLRGTGLAQSSAARYELLLARSLVMLGLMDEARASLRRATVGGGETAAEAHAVLAEIAEAGFDRDHAVGELDTAIGSLVELARESIAEAEVGGGESEANRLYARAAELAMLRATLLDQAGHADQAAGDWARAHELAGNHAPQIAREAARTMLSRSGGGHAERRWIDAVLATEPPAPERAALLVHRADVRRHEAPPDLVAAVADLREAIAAIEGLTEDSPSHTRRRAYQLEAELLALSGDRRARAQALSALARMADRAIDKVAVETAAASAWLEADEPTAALPHAARAHAELPADASPALRRDVLTTLGEAAWRQRAWPDVIRAYRGLVADAGVEPLERGGYRYRLAVGADRSGDPELALESLRALVIPTNDDDDARATPPEIRGKALRLYADLAERSGDLGAAATALEAFANVAAESTPSARADAMYRAGELFRRANRPDDAVRCLEGALRISETHLPALDALELAWRERGDLERVSVILGRKVAATTRHPQRQKPLLSRLGDLQDQLGRPEVALATHQRALEIDPTWRPSLRYVTSRLQAEGAIVAAAEGVAQLAGELPGDSGADSAVVARERQLAAQALAELVGRLDAGQLESVGSFARPALERAAASGTDVASALARLRGEPAPRAPTGDSEENTQSGRSRNAAGGALSLRDAAARSRAAGKLDDALASLETANHVSPGDVGVLRELVDVASEVGDHSAAARHLAALAGAQSGARRADTLLELADLFYDQLDDAGAARSTMRDAADELGPGARRDATLRMLASESATHLAWDSAVDALGAIADDRRTAADIIQLATALLRAGRPLDAAMLAERNAELLADDGMLARDLRAEVARRDALDRNPTHDFPAPIVLDADAEELDPYDLEPDDESDGEPVDRIAELERVANTATGREQAAALHELALIARGSHDPIRAAALWTKAHRVDPAYPPVWMPLADALVGADDLDAARELYERIAESTAYDAERRAFAAERAEALGHDESIISGEFSGRASSVAPELEAARELAEADDLQGAIAAAERAAAESPDDASALQLLEVLYFEAGDITAASEAIGRQLVAAEQPEQRAVLWRRRAKLYRDALGRDAEAYRCLKEAHACAPADPEIAYQLRTAAMVRGEWALVASLLYREIAAAGSPRDRGALHLELALIYAEKLDDPAQAQVNFEQALAFDPTIPAARAPLAARYEAIGRFFDAARLYDEAASAARPSDRAQLLASAARCRSSANEAAGQSELASKLATADAAGELEAASELAHQLWRAEPGHPAAFRVLASRHRAAGDLAALTEITSAYAARSADAPNAERLALGEARAAAWLDVARLADDLGVLEEAARAYDLALIEDPGHARALDARGGLAFRLGDYATADLIYRDLAPGESELGEDDLALRRSLIAEQLGRESEALELARVAAAAAPGRIDLLARVQSLAARIGELDLALAAARSALELISLDDYEGQMRASFALVELMRQSGDLAGAITQLEHVVRDHPLHAVALDQLAELHIARNEWQAATRYLFQLVALAPTPAQRAERLFRLGEAVDLHLGDRERADDVFLRASDLDPSHVPTLRRLLDVYWRNDDPAALVEVATELASAGGLVNGPIASSSLAHALIAAALVGDTPLATHLVGALGDDAARWITGALDELSGRQGRFELSSASTAIAELARRGLVDLAKLRAAASGTPVARILRT